VTRDDTPGTGVTVHRIAQPGENNFSAPDSSADPANDPPKPPPGCAPIALDAMSGRVRPTHTWDSVLDSLPPNSGIL
jgi:hypothetical protein